MKTSSSQLKAHFGRFLREVRRGRAVVVTDRDVPVARLVPYAEPKAAGLVIEAPREPSACKLGAVKVRGVRVAGVDSTALLREDRERR